MSRLFAVVLAASLVGGCMFNPGPAYQYRALQSQEQQYRYYQNQNFLPHTQPSAPLYNCTIQTC